MAPVQENMAQLTPEDRKAIAAYIKSLPARPDAVPKSEQKKDDEEEEDGAAPAETPEPAGEGGNGQQEHDVPE
jgi:hypothetical protein